MRPIPAIAKYLPIEGEEIQIGDRYINVNYSLSKKQPTPPIRIMTEEDYNSKYNFKYKEGWTKVKLFAVTQNDIKEGDEIVYLSDYFVENASYVPRYGTRTTSRYSEGVSSDWWKIIGEISDEMITSKNIKADEKFQWIEEGRLDTLKEYLREEGVRV